MNNQDNKINILMLCFPATGHLNPMISFANHLAKSKNVRVIFFGNLEHREMIEKTGAEFRHVQINDPTAHINPNELRKNLPVDIMMKFFMDATELIMPHLIRLIENEHIDLIIYDFLTLYAKWFMSSLRNKYKRGEIRKRPPPAVMFSASFLHQKNLYPNESEKKMSAMPRLTVTFVFKMVIFFFRYVYFCYKMGLQIENPIEIMFSKREDLNLVCIVPELHPRHHLYPKTVKFVGSCASEEIRSIKEFEEPLKSFLEPFKVINPVKLNSELKIDASPSADNDSLKLIFCSFGTVVNQDIEPFIKIIDAVQQLNAKSNRIRLLISTGDKTYRLFQSRIDSKQWKVPSNTLIVSRVPQLDVLKRSHLFITHSGQNSTSESMHYGVPMLCIPVMADQPSVAYRVADELGLGKRLVYDDLKSDEVAACIEELLTDRSYLERTALYSIISHKYNGPAEASKIVLEYIQQKNK